MNKVVIKGRLATDVDLKTTPSGAEVCNFTVAVNRKFDRETADFISCEAWRNTAEFISKYFSKGKEILVVGELHIDQYEKDGEKRSRAKIVIDDVEFCGGAKSETGTTETNADVTTGYIAVNDSSDLPF